MPGVCRSAPLILTPHPLLILTLAFTLTRTSHLSPFTPLTLTPTPTSMLALTVHLHPSTRTLPLSPSPSTSPANLNLTLTNARCALLRSIRLAALSV